MVTNSAVVPDLISLLEGHQEEIATSWAEMVRQIPGSHYRQLSLDEIRASTLRGVGAVIEALKTGSYTDLETYLNEVSLNRLQLGFSIGEVIEALLLFKDAIPHEIQRGYSQDPTSMQEAVHEVDACSRWMACRFAVLYADEANLRLKREQQRIALMLSESQSLGRVTAALLQELGLGEVLDIVCTEAQGLTGAVGSTVFLLDAEHDGWLRVARSTGVASPNFTQIPIDGSLTGKAVRAGKLFLFNDPASEVQTYGIGVEPTALLAVPLRVKGIIIGVLDMVNKPSGFTQEDVRISSLFADQAAVAIENARLYQQAQELAAVQERQRLARDLHDAVTQTLFSASLIAEVLPRLWERDLEEGQRRLMELRELTRGALAEMRTLLLELRPAALADAVLGDLLRQLGESITGRARIPVAVEVEGECVLEPEVKIALYRIAQEALNNIAKHAGASQALVNLRCQPGWVLMRVSDDGIGFDPQSIPPESLGLGIMRERVKAIGAALDIESEVDHGTQVVVVWRGTGVEELL